MLRYKALNLIDKIFHKFYFTYAELCCKCGCDKFDCKPEFLHKLLLFRVFYGKPFTPRSVYRCKDHKDYSTNHDGWAIDVPCGNSNERMKIIKAAILAGFDRIGINVESTFVHLDCNPEYKGEPEEEVLWIY